VIEHPGKSPSRMIYLAEKRGEPTKYNVFRTAINKAMENCIAPNIFQKRLEKAGFIVRMSDRRKYATIALLGDTRPTRFVRLGEAYDERNLIYKMYHTHYKPQEFVSAKPKPQPQRMQFHGRFQKTKKLTGFRALYFHYLYLLGKLPIKQDKPRPPVHVIFYEDLRKMHTYSEQIKLLARNKIDTLPQLQTFADTTKTRMDDLIGQRTKIQNKLRRVQDPEVKSDFLKQKSELTVQITVFRKDLKLCDGIAENTRRMHEKIALYRTEQVKQQEKSKQINKTKERGYAR
jgi:hypothetical protein